MFLPLFVCLLVFSFIIRCLLLVNKVAYIEHVYSPEGRNSKKTQKRKTETDRRSQSQSQSSFNDG